MSDDIFELGISELSGLYERKEISPVEVFESTAARIERVDETLNMFAVLDLDRAAAQAQAAHERMMAGRRRHALDGIPTSIKDLISVKGLPLRFGSKATGSENAQVDAPAVSRLLERGAVILGKSTTSEFGCKAVGDSPLTGVTRNPWDTRMTPGGSSCGAAAMVAAGVVPYAIGTDGGGSLRIPGALSGLVGFKPQFARAPVAPAAATPTLAHVGPLTRSVQDSDVVLNAICGYDSRDPFSYPESAIASDACTRGRGKLKVAWSPTLGYAKPTAEVAACCARAADLLEHAGHRVEKVDSVIDDPIDIWTAEFYAGVGTRLRSIVESTPEILDPSVRTVLEQALNQQMRRYYEGVFERYDLREKLRQFFEVYDVLVTPTVPTDAFAVSLDKPPTHEDRNIVSWAYYTYPFNLTGQPAMSLPVGVSAQGLPIGLQLVAPMHGDETLLGVASALEKELGFDKHAGQRRLDAWMQQSA